MMCDKGFVLKVLRCKNHPHDFIPTFQFNKNVNGPLFCVHCLNEYFVKLGFEPEEIGIDENGNEVNTDK